MRKKENNTNQLVRAALYVRVSGEEQKIKGLSLEAQQERLEAYAKEKGWIIVGIYIDAAKTARKDMRKRVEFQRMIEAVKRDEVDVLLFCRLDRWFRSVADYYKIMEILDAHNCNWKTTDEEYDTSTANGRLYINVKLSIAQNEADICGERIEVIFDSKIAHGTVISGSCPFGYRINDKKQLEVIEEQANIVQDIFDCYEKSVSKYGTTKYVREKYGINWSPWTIGHIISEKLYTGVYDRNDRYNDNFCPPIINNEQFERIQNLSQRNVYFAPSGRIYLFASIIKCAECEHNLIGYVASHRETNRHYYRCNQYAQRGRCSHNRSAREDYIEQWLLDNISAEFRRYRIEWEVRAAKKKQDTFSVDRAAIKRKLKKLKELYINDLIDLEDYRKDYQTYTAALNQTLNQTKEEPPDFEAIEAVIGDNFGEVYRTFSREEKRTLWRSIIKEICIDKDNNIVSIVFV
ncbi:MAG: recombinase family protein [Lachnospiraceae bacterium]|nr:recombinase family protein [Lachnospiraceae bacterium]